MVIEDEIVKRILDIIDRKDIRVPEVFCNEDFDDFEDEVRDVLYAEGIEATFSQGASKFVIVPADSDYVIKIPFNFCGDEEDVEYYENSDEEDNFYGDYHPFHCNYCDEEDRIYEEAEDWEVEDAFSELGVVKTTNTMQCFYIQEKVVPLCDLYEDNFTKVKSPIKISEDTEERYSKFDHWNSLNPTFVKAMIEFFGIDFVMQFDNFLDTCGVSDLHDGNYGFRVSDNKPVIFDYGGYSE